VEKRKKVSGNLQQQLNVSQQETYQTALVSNVPVQFLL